MVEVLMMLTEAAIRMLVRMLMLAVTTVEDTLLLPLLPLLPVLMEGMRTPTAVDTDKVEPILLMAEEHPMFLQLHLMVRLGLGRLLLANRLG